MTKYDSIIYCQLANQDVKLVGKIIKATFKKAQYIHYDKASIIMHKDGIDTDAVLKNVETAVGEQ